MSRMQQAPTIFIHSLILLSLLAAVPGLLFAKSGSIDVPENATENRYGNGWECDPGFRVVDGTCVAIKMPANAYSTNRSYGRGWECDRGYRVIDGTCIPIKVPANSYLNVSGDKWQCKRGFRVVGENCVAIKVPANGFLTNSGHGLGWACDRGFKQLNESCISVKMPENAHLDYSGNNWECDRPYRKRQGGCALP